MKTMIVILAQSLLMGVIAATAANGAAVPSGAGAMLPRPGPEGREVGEACSSGVDETCFSAVVPWDQDVEAWHPATATSFAAVLPPNQSPPQEGTSA